MKRQDDAQSNACDGDHAGASSMVAKLAEAHRQARLKDLAIKRRQKSPRAAKERDFLADFARNYEMKLIRAGQDMLSSIGAGNPAPVSPWVNFLQSLDNSNWLKFAWRRMFPNTGLHSNISPPDQYSSFAEWKLELNDQHNTSLRLKFKLQARGEKFTAADLSRACIHIDMPSPRIEANEEMLRYMLRQALRLGNYVRQLTGANVKLTANINTDQVWADEEIKTLNLESVQADARLTRRALKSSILAHVILYFDTSKSGPVLH